MAMRQSLILSWRGPLPFSGVTLTVLFSKLKSVHLSIQASPALIPVSLSSCKKTAVFLLHEAIRLFTSSSVGIKGSFLTDLYFGGIQVFPSARTYRKARACNQSSIFF